MDVCKGSAKIHVNSHNFLGGPCHVLNGNTEFISSPEPKAHGELIVYWSIRRPSVR